MGTPEGNWRGALTVTAIVAFAVAETGAARGVAVAVEVVVSRAEACSGGPAGKRPPAALTIGGAVAPVSATRKAYWPRPGTSAASAPLAPARMEGLTMSQAWAASS